MPFRNADGERLGLFLSDLLVEADDQCPDANGAHSLFFNGTGLNRNTKVKSQLQ